MDWNLPIAVNIDGVSYEIESQCDYRMVLDCLAVYEDAELDLKYQHSIAFRIFYKDYESIDNVEEAVKQMVRIIDCKSEEEFSRTNTVKKQAPERLMSWTQDFKYIAPAVSRILGYDIRTPGKYTHWWTFWGAYLEIGESVWSTIVNIRRKKAHNEKLEKWEDKIYRENRDAIDLVQNITAEEREWLESDW